MRPPGPLPVTRERSTPTSRAKRRTAGPAATPPPSWVGSGGLGAGGAGSPSDFEGPAFGSDGTGADSCLGGAVGAEDGLEGADPVVLRSAFSEGGTAC